MKVYLIYDKKQQEFIGKRPIADGRKYLVYGDIRSARIMANSIKKYGLDYQDSHKGNNIVVVEYQANIEHMKEV